LIHHSLTPLRIGKPTMEMLLRWAMRFVKDLADDIISTYDDYLEVPSRTPDQRRRTGRQGRRTLRALTVANPAAITRP
jgi:hypothetical protein